MEPAVAQQEDAVGPARRIRFAEMANRTHKRPIVIKPRPPSVLFPQARRKPAIKITRHSKRVPLAPHKRSKDAAV